MISSHAAFAHAYLQAPFSIFDEATATALVPMGWQQLATNQGIDVAKYSIANCLVTPQAVTTKPNQLVLTASDALLVEVEEPEFERLQAFYDEHGLEPLPAAELLAGHVVAKLRRALAVLAEVAPAYACVRTLVRSVQVLRQPDPEIDVSYSHPAVPFSIFVTVCEEDSPLASLRIAEAVLHETMHLYLTLLEAIVDLVLPGSTALYYSPWRDEDRPVRGVLQGLFVFRAVQAFYQALIAEAAYASDLREFASERIAAITQEVQLLTGFTQANGLTAIGKQLAANLLECHADLSTSKNYASSQ
jgi:HEXXH motif-containing protein